MPDIITSLGNSKIQHGKNNDRIYLMKLSPVDLPGIINELDLLARENDYGKIFVKVPEKTKYDFIDNGYLTEAVVPVFFNDEKAYFMARFFSEERQRNIKAEETDKVLQESLKKALNGKTIKLEPGFTVGICSSSDVLSMAEVYKKVFATYPFPIYDPDYILKTMEKNVLYFAVRYSGKIVALSSAEMDREFGNTEMTDFAVLPEYGGKGFASYLLQLMESEVKESGIKTAYTIARALSYGMNITFAKTGYSFAGILVNNTNIGGSFESMNVWYKSLL